MHAAELARTWHDRFQRHAADLFPGLYTLEYCRELAELAVEIRALAVEKKSTIVAHNYQRPELQEVADFVGDSLGLALEVQRRRAPRVDFSSVHFMGATAKIILGDATRVFVQGTPEVHGCSLVLGTDHRWIERWKAKNQGGVCVTYVNSDVRTKAMSEYISTSRNTAAVIARAAREHAGQILVLPDKFLGAVMKAQAVTEFGVDPDRVEIYTHPFGHFNACCYVHERIGADAPEQALEEYDDAELLLHPECGCASSCLLKLSQGILPKDRVFYLSTEGMLERVKASPAKRFVVGTESGMIYRLRKELPDRDFHPVSVEAVCEFMKQNTLRKLRDALRTDTYEIVLDPDADPHREVADERVIRINTTMAAKARAGVLRMLDT
jgi:quinolinate synthase